MFAKLYTKTMSWARHPYAERYLGGLSFMESSFFPIPPDVMLIPMSLARIDRAWRYAAIATVTSVLGGVLGYFIGVFFLEMITPILKSVGYWPKFEQIKLWFDEWGVWVVFLAGFSPIPYKIFTIGAGAFSVSFLPFVLASLIGRGARFYLVCGLMVLGGEKMEVLIRKYVEWLGWLVIVACVVLYFIYR